MIKGRSVCFWYILVYFTKKNLAGSLDAVRVPCRRIARRPELTFC
jgi:hypothetical protein